jgi:hypothetical protein
VDILLDVIGGVASALREGCPRTTTGVSQRWFSGHFRQMFSNTTALPQVFINAGARLLCTLDGVCVIVYVKFSSVGAGTVWEGGSSLHPGIEFGRSRT